MLLQEELVNLIYDNPHPFEHFGTLRRDDTMGKILRQFVKLLREVFESVSSHEPSTVPRHSENAHTVIPVVP
jgi:hypothetical protein